MSYNPSSPFDLEVAAGRVAGITAVHKFGEATDADSGIEVDAWDGANATDQIDVWVAPTTARTHTIASDDATDTSAGVGARTVRIQGLTSWGAEEVSEDVTMNGTSNVTTTNSFVIIHRMKVLTAGTSGPNVGNISATAVTDGTLTAQIRDGKGQTMMAIYGIPSTHTLYVTSFYGSVLRSAAGVGAEVSMVVNEAPDVNLTHFVHKHESGLNSVGLTKAQHRFNPMFKVAGPAIVKMHVEPTTVNTVVTAGFDGYLEEN